jgi:predicted aspartyl protease
MTLEFDGSAGLVVVPTRIHGPKGTAILQLALDTGATTTLINSEVLALIGYESKTSADRIPVTTGSGLEFVARVQTEKIEALDQSRRSFPVLSHTLPPTAMVDGVLGLDFFRGLRLILDFRAGTIVLE